MCAERGISLSRMGELAGVSHATAIWAASGKTSMTMDTLAKLAEALDVDPQELLKP